MPAFEEFCYLVPMLQLSYPVYQALVWAVNHCDNSRLRQKKFLGLLIRRYAFAWQGTFYAHPDRSISTRSRWKVVENPLVSLAETHRTNGAMELSLSFDQTELGWRTWKENGVIPEIFWETNTEAITKISSHQFFSRLDQLLPDPVGKK